MKTIDEIAKSYCPRSYEQVVQVKLEKDLDVRTSFPYMSETWREQEALRRVHQYFKERNNVRVN